MVAFEHSCGPLRFECQKDKIRSAEKFFRCVTHSCTKSSSSCNQTTLVIDQLQIKSPLLDIYVYNTWYPTKPKE